MRNHDITPPHSLETEQWVLGAILIDHRLGPAKELTSEDFYNKNHADIFKMCLNLHDEGDPIDIITVSQRLNGNSDTAYLTQLVTATPTSANLSYHARILREYAFKRKVLYIVFSIIRDITTLSPTEITEQLSELTQGFENNNEKHREVNLAREVERWISLTDGDFSLTDCYNSLQSIKSLTIPYTRNNLHQIFYRLKESGVIQKVGSKNGVYRRVDDTAEEIEWWNADSKALDIKFPFGEEKLVSIYPKNIVLIAGESNSGKTAWCLNVVLLNKQLHKITYLSSEMGAIELKTRLSKFDNPLDDWKKVKFRERSSNFSDVIDPDGFNIIDYLEITTDFWLIASLIKEIYDKLNKGICIISIQKNKGTDFGRGGQMGLEKPRLYLSMEAGKIKIIKAKSWTREKVNPNGLQNEFKLVQGCKFVQITGWHKEGEL